MSQESPLKPEESKEIALEQLNKTIEKQGFDVLKEKNTYTVTATNHWQGLLGKIAKPWPEACAKLKFQYNFNTFDGRAAFLNGKKEGSIIGIQSGVYYEQINPDAKLEQIKRLNKKQHKQKLGLEVFHYFIELPLRLKNAPILRYYGEKTHQGKNYELVFASWESEAANKKYDQFVLWINRETNLLEYVYFTVRENKGLLKRTHYSSMSYRNYENQDGFLVPQKIAVFIDDKVLTKAPDEYLHQYDVHEFKMKSFEEKLLYPLPGLEKKIDSK